MEWDYFVYSRGVDRTDGYALRIGPGYLPLKACIAFMDKALTDSDSTIWNESGSNILKMIPKARNDSFVYINVERAKSCILMRTVKICSSDGVQKCDFQGRPLWSLEGVCCPYEQRYEFFAVLPSLILALKRDKDILHTHFLNGEEKYLIPDDLLYNAYADLPLRMISDDEAEQKLFQNLTNSIYCAEEPYSFTYGSLAGPYLAMVKDMYKTEVSFSLFDNVDKEPVDNFFGGYKPLEISRPHQTQRDELALECGIQSDKEGDSFVWRIRSISPQNSQYELYSQPEPFSAESGMRMSIILAKAKSVQHFAKQMLWELDPNNPYRYFKEG